MAEIQLPQRTEVGPRQAGVAKPGFNLVEGAGLAQAGAAVAGVSEKLFSDLLRSKVANEKAEGVGQVNALVESYHTTIAGNPNMSQEEMLAEWGKVESKIRKIPNFAKTKQGKADLGNLITQQMPLARQKAESGAVAIAVRHEAEKFKLLEEGFMQNLDPVGLTNLYEEHGDNISNNKEKLDLKLEVMAEAQKKVAIDNIGKLAFTAWEESIPIDGSDPDGNLNAEGGAFDIIDASPMSEDDKTKVKNDLTSRVNSRRAEDELQAQQNFDKAKEDVAGLVVDGQYANINNEIAKMPVTDAEKIELFKYADDAYNSINNSTGVKATSDEANIAYNELVDRVNSGEVTAKEATAIYRKDISPLVKATESQSRLNGFIKAEEDANNPVFKRSVVIDGLKNIDALSKIKVGLADDDLALISEEMSATTANKERLRQWAIDNKDDPNFATNFQKQIDAAMEPAAEEVTLNWFQKTFAPFPESLLRDKKRNAAIDAFKETDIYQSLSKEDKKIAKKYFTNRGTVEGLLAFMGETDSE